MTNNNLSGLARKIQLGIVLFSLIVLSVYFNSCASSEIADSKDVNQAKIYHSYSVYYDAANGDSYQINAQFRFGGNKGTTLRLSSPSNVKVNDAEMNEKTQALKGCYYETQITGTNEFKFIFTDTEDKTFSNKCKVNPINTPSIKMINAEGKNQINWIGPPLEKGEKVSINIEDNEGNKAYIDTDILGADYITVTKDDLAKLVGGKGQLYLTRTFTEPAKEAADEGGSIFTSYQTEKIGIEILKKNN